MAEDLNLTGTSKAEIYASLIPQLEALVHGEADMVANLANVSAALKQAFGFFWVGFYQVKQNELVLGPFQGTVACTRIAKGKGVCGQAWELKKSLLVPDVDAFPGHIACSSLSRSEVVVPIFKAQEVWGVLDVDSDQLDAFDHTDVVYLEQIAQWIGNFVS